MTKRIVIFLILNFVALGIGGMFTNTGVSSEWYQSLSKAPWTPPGWVFGAAWTFIMVCFAVYMAYLGEVVERKKMIMLFVVQWILNVVWNPVFFYYQGVTLGLIIITSLTVLIAYFFFNFREELKEKSLLIAPYLIWLVIASSLNAYILLNN